MALKNLTPAESGFAYELMTAKIIFYYLPKCDDLLKALPSIEERKASIINNILVNANPHKIEADNKNEMMVDWIQSHREWCASGEYATMKLKLQSEIKVETLTEDHFKVEHIKELMVKHLKKETDRIIQD